MEFHPIPQPEEVSEREKQDAMGAYLMMFATTALGLPLPIVNMSASVVYFFVNKSKGRFVQFHSLQSMYSQIPVSLLNSYLIVWAVYIFANDAAFTNVFWGLLITAGIFNLFYFIFSIIGAVKAYHGRFYYFLFFGKIAYIQAYKIKNETEVKQQQMNMPPKM